MIRMSEEEYLAMRGVASPVSKNASNKTFFPQEETAKEKADRLAGYEEAEREYQRKRHSAQEEYRKLVAQGDVMPKMKEERNL